MISYLPSVTCLLYTSNRVKERKVRTRRLIQEDAILEKVLPEVRTMELSALEDYLMQKLPQHN